MKKQSGQHVVPGVNRTRSPEAEFNRPWDWIDRVALYWVRAVLLVYFVISMLIYFLLR